MDLDWIEQQPTHKANGPQKNYFRGFGCKQCLNFVMRSSINDVTALGGRASQGFCDNSTKALLIESVRGVKNYQLSSGVI